MSRYTEAEAAYGHPLQYAMVAGGGLREAYIAGTEHLTDDQVLDKLRAAHDDSSAAQIVHALDHRPAHIFYIERYDRCPTCEQWSPCTMRRATMSDTEKEVPPE